MTGSADLTAALRAHARGLHCLQAAVELLIGHASWLRQGDFLHEFVHTVPGLIDGTPMAPIDWPEAIAALDRGRLPCSGGEDAAVSARGNAARAREPGMRRRARRRTAVRAARNRTRCSGRRRW